MALERRMTGRGEWSGERDEEEHRLPAYDHGMADGRD
jgi:hypothetical protein